MKLLGERKIEREWKGQLHAKSAEEHTSIERKKERKKERKTRNPPHTTLVRSDDERVLPLFLLTPMIAKLTESAVEALPSFYGELHHRRAHCITMVLWVFGYGSLLWKAGFEYDERMIGFIKGYRRVFYQASTDHRGTPEYPGRVVTLEAKEGEVTWGAAYRVSGHDNEKLVLSYLDLREQEYDQKAYVNLYTAGCFEMPALCNVLVYIGSSDISKNKFWAGPAPLEVMAERIARAVGPSGPNYEYLFLLEQSLRELDCVDKDICELAEAVRRYMTSNNGLDSSASVSGTNITTETQSMSRKQEHDECNGV